MLHKARRLARHLKHCAKTALLGPQILAFVPALTLGGYWFGGEGVLLFMAILIPALLGLVGIFTPMGSGPAKPRPRDPVTDLPLREELEERLGKFLEKEEKTGLRTACVVVVIDEFQSCEAMHGTAATDEVLRQATDRLRGVVRGSDVVARLDGPCFGIALSPVRRIDLESLIQLSARMQEAMAHAIVIDGLRVFVTASIGFCLPRRDAERTGTACLGAAEAALADAQSHGNGTIRAFSSQPQRKRLHQSGLIDEVSEALGKGEVKPWFQPQVSTDTGEVTGMEALARWEHPERGIILPGIFLPAIAAAGLNERLSEIMLYHSLTALQNWDRAGLQVPSVSVNFSGDELSDPKLIEKTRWELDRFDLAPERLTVEILETVIDGAQDDVVTRNVAELSKLGCNIDLDDFGTGHASIAHIRRFRVGRIKIDRAFVTRIDADREQQQMLTAILEMANQLEIETLAEGVETVGEHALLAQLGCGHVQGYSIARPMPFGDTIEWLREHDRKLDAQPKITRQTG